MEPYVHNTPTTRTTSRWFYGWVIVAICSLTLLVAFGIRLSFSVFFVALIDDFGWSRADTALIFSVSMGVFTLSSTLSGAALDRFGARAVFGFGAGLTGLGLLLSSQINTLQGLAITYGGVAGLGLTILGLGPQASLISRWFQKKRGVAIGLAFAGTGLGAFILTPATEYIIRNIGWRWAYAILAVLILAIIPLIFLFLRLSPTQMGLHPDGDSTHTTKTVLFYNPEGNWTIWQAIRTPAFWLVIAASLGAVGPLRLLTVHQLAVMVDAGFESVDAASAVGTAGGVTALAYVLFGALSDRIGRRAAYAIGSLCMISAIATLASLTDPSQTRWLLLYAILVGLGEGSRSSLVVAVASDLFPGNAIGTITGSVGAAFGMGAMVFPWLGGHIYDTSGSYTIAFVIVGVAVSLSTLALWLAPSIHRASPRNGDTSPTPGRNPANPGYQHECLAAD